MNDREREFFVGAVLWAIGTYRLVSESKTPRRTFFLSPVIIAWGVARFVGVSLWRMTVLFFDPAIVAWRERRAARAKPPALGTAERHPFEGSYREPPECPLCGRGGAAGASRTELTPAGENALREAIAEERVDIARRRESDRLHRIRPPIPEDEPPAWHGRYVPPKPPRTPAPGAGRDSTE